MTRYGKSGNYIFTGPKWNVGRAKTKWQPEGNSEQGLLARFLLIHYDVNLTSS